MSSRHLFDHDAIGRHVRESPSLTELGLWVVAGAALVGDVLLTYHGLAAGAWEVNPVARALMAAVGPVPAMAVLKGAALAVALAGRHLVPPSHRAVVPAALATPWVIAVFANASLLAGIA
jgi:hypothetical protein